MAPSCGWRRAYHLGYNSHVQNLRSVSAAPIRPTVVFDGDCGFCRFWVDRWRSRTGDRVEYLAFQTPEIVHRFPEIPAARFAGAIHLIEPDGRMFEGAEAVFRLRAQPTLLKLYTELPGAAAASEWAYRVVADHRLLFARITTLLWGRVTQPPTYARSAWLFRRLLGVIYLIAFWSLATQIVGLIGHDGILPASTSMDAARAFVGANHLGFDRFRLLPTLCWLSSSDAFLRALCVGGIVLASLLVVGLVPLVVLPLLWVDYLSLSVVGRDFLSFQWDALLLETGFLAIALAPAVWRDRRSDRAEPPRIGRWLLMWLVFRLMVGSGAVKLASGDPTWSNLTALTFHYETQPIPTPIAWYAHQLPAWFHQASATAVLTIELVAPFFMLGPRRPRLLAFALLVGLQVLIALTGNYAFFNLLAAALCLCLLDDAALASVTRPFRGRVPSRPARVTGLRSAALGRVLSIAAAVVTVPVAALAFASSVGLRMPGAPLVSPVAQLIGPFRSVNSYGLFAVMTTTRPEIVVQGSDDGADWKPYEFKYKAGDLQRRPPWVAPLQPRLDWQMWFAALGRYADEQWFQRFCQRLLAGAPEVLQLLERDPFGGRPPHYVRAVLYRYHFTDEASGKRGAWWTREPIGAYSPVLTLGSR